MQSKFEEPSNTEWKIIEKILDDQRNRCHSLRSIMNAILWINYTGAQWRNLDSPRDPVSIHPGKASIIISVNGNGQGFGNNSMMD